MTSFDKGMIEETNGNKVKVKLVMGANKGETREYKQDVVGQEKRKNVTNAGSQMTSEMGGAGITQKRD